MSEMAASIGYLSDRETKVDLLNNEAIAKTIVGLLREKSDHPISIGVHGDWGAGKSSILEMVEAALSNDKRILCLKFSGWQFQGFEDAKIALIEKVVEGLIEKRGLVAKAGEQVKEILKNIDWLKVATKGGGLAITALTGLPVLGLTDMIGSLSSQLTSVIQDKDSRDAALEGLERFKKEKEEGKATGKSIPKEISAFRKRFKELIKTADIDRLVVLVDDLDRCLPKAAIETLEAIRLFVFMDKTAFVIGADEQMIEYSVRKHFPDLPDGREDQGYARAYLEKLVQVPFRIPALGETETRIYVTLLLLGAALGKDEKTFNALLNLGRKALSRPWEGKSFDEQEINSVLGDKLEKLRPVLITAEQISPVLSAGTKGNPRQIKRFLNALTLRLAVAKARNFGDAIEQTRLAKLMLAELFLPDSVFSQIASAAATSPDGKCSALAALEGLAANRFSLTPSKQPETSEDYLGEGAGTDVVGQVPEDVRELMADWSTRADVMRWARVQPELGDTPLKPYLFVIKDRKNYLSAETPLTVAQADLLARLAGGNAMAASAQAEVEKLGPADLEVIFNALKRQVLASTSFDSKPSAMFGIEAMVKAASLLQERYVEFLNALPAARLGAWAAAGHGPLVRSPGAHARLAKVIEKWRKAGGPALKRAISSGDKTPERRPRGT